MALHQQGQGERAEAIYRDVLRMEPEEPNAWHLLGVLAWQKSDLATAEHHIRLAIRLRDHVSTYYNNLAGVLAQKGDLLGAIASYETTIRLAPDDDAARGSLAEVAYRHASHMMGALQLDQAKVIYQRVLELAPKHVSAINNLAMITQHEGRYAEAASLYDEALMISPGNLAVRYNRALCYLTQRRLPEGWADFTAAEPHWRHMQDPRQAQELPWRHCPLLDSDDLDGKQILIWGDQGIGDEILYAGAIPDLLERGAHVTIECMDRLVPLFARSFPNARILARRVPPLPGAEFDFQASGMWLSRILRPDLNSFPDRKSFLVADAERSSALRQRYEGYGKKRILGISWFTNSKPWGLKRSLPLPEMLRHLELEDLLLVDLQYGDSQAAWREAQEMFPSLTFIHDNEIDQFRDMDAFAAQITACDYVLAINNTVAHVAGALGVLSGIMVPDAGLTWYWFDNGRRCPFYPSLTLWRSSEPGRLELAARLASSQSTRS